MNSSRMPVNRDVAHRFHRGTMGKLLTIRQGNKWLEGPQRTAYEAVYWRVVRYDDHSRTQQNKLMEDFE